ncbi:uncharacterized protein [Physcomitrium patens]|uniref:uncharacterized protein isoform X2 n=1 Tax=Physcomitrium patens TaxID=3218 RepID=UPI003CCD266A
MRLSMLLRSVARSLTECNVTPGPALVMSLLVLFMKRVALLGSQRIHRTPSLVNDYRNLQWRPVFEGSTCTLVAVESLSTLVITSPCRHHPLCICDGRLTILQARHKPHISPGH